MKNKPLLVQLVLSFCVILLVLLALVGSFFYQTSSSAIETSIEGNSHNTIQQTSQFIQSYIQKLEQTATSLTRNSLVTSYARTSSPEEASQVRNLFDTILQTDKDLVAAVLVTKSGQVISTDESLAMKTSSDMMEEPWYVTAIHQGSMPVLTPARMGTAKDQWVVSVTQELVDDKGENLGVLRLDIGYETLSHYLDQLQLGSEGFAFIVNDQHQFVYHPHQTVYTSRKEMAAMQPYIEARDSYTKDGKAYVSQTRVAGTDWTLIGVSSLEQLRQVRGKILHSILWTGLAGFSLSLVIVWLVIRRWIAPLKDLQNTMGQVGEGTSNLRAREAGAPELRDLAQQFNLMLDRIDQLMQDVREQEQTARQYELKALSAQINPHFLYNTLDTIVWMAEFNDSQRVVQLTKSLAKYFRLALNQGRDEIRLSDEIDHVRQYLFIQKQRYGDQLDYEIEEDPRFNDFLLPKLVLQPLVENAIYHGIKEKSGGGKICLTVTDRGDSLRIKIQDDGVGFKTQAETSQTLLKLGGVGLKNVDQRLRLYFGEAYEMTISSKETIGTEVSLRLPKGENHER